MGYHARDSPHLEKQLGIIWYSGLCRSVWQLTGLVNPAFRVASLTARCSTDSCR